MYTTVICTHRTQAMTPSGKASCLDRGRSPGPSRWAPWRHPSPDHKPAADCTGPPAFPSSPPPVQPTSLRIAGTASAAHRCSAAPGAVPGGQNSPEHNNVVRDLQICYALNKIWGEKKMRRWWRIRGSNEWFLRSGPSGGHTWTVSSYKSEIWHLELQ